MIKVFPLIDATVLQTTVQQHKLLAYYSDARTQYAKGKKKRKTYSIKEKIVQSSPFL